jgi:hypothetical protein
MQPALIGGVFIGILSALPFVNLANYCCCLWVLSGGVIAAVLDQQRDPGRLPVGRAAYDGLVAGIVGAIVWLAASMVLDAAMSPLYDRAVTEMLRNASDMPPAARAYLENVGSRASSPVSYVLGFLFHLFVGAVFGTIGGIVGVTVFGRSESAGLPRPE